MHLNEQINSFYSRPEHSIKAYYLQLTANQSEPDSQLDFGFVSSIKNGKDFHHITKDIVVSVNQIVNQRQTNIFFKNNMPLRMELQDDELIKYYTDYIELRYIMTGYLNVEIENELIRFEEGEICFIDSMAYRRESLSNSECVLININIDRNVFNEAFLNSIELNALQKFLRTNIMKLSKQQNYLRFKPLSESTILEIQNYIFTIIEENKKRLPGYLDISKGYIIRLMDQLARNYEYDFNRQDSRIYQDKLFESINEYMKNNLDVVTMNDLEHEFFFKANYFNNLIKKYTGLTYSHYLINLRMEKSKSLLYMTNLPIEEIMFIVGYNNKGFFYKKFYELTGMSPKEYRTKVQNKKHDFSTQ